MIIEMSYDKKHSNIQQNVGVFANNMVDIIR